MRDLSNSSCFEVCVKLIISVHLKFHVLKNFQALGAGDSKVMLWPVFAFFIADILTEHSHMTK